MHRPLSLLVAILGLVSCRGTAGSPPDASRETEFPSDSIWPRYLDAARQRDTAAYGRLFTDDAVVIFTSVPTVRGRAAIQVFAHTLYAGVEVQDLRMAPAARERRDSLAVEAGQFEERFLEGDTVRTEYGRYAAVFRHGADGHWRLAQLTALADSLRP